MNRRDFIRTALAASAGLALGGKPSMAQHTPHPKAPNLLFVF
ncbi:MAG: twin-arginine translocation signal domain-containing protein, partial [Planctomycetes bacterium]|nr:twin-arginine translocation signal domain-containing protein [Planctomycetota bacterium]